MIEPSSTYRLRALAREQRAREASDPAIKKEWEELAIQWHLPARPVKILILCSVVEFIISRFVDVKSRCLVKHHECQPLTYRRAGRRD
jgi:hypothetical protein